MKMTNAIQTGFFLTHAAVPTPPRWGGFNLAQTEAAAAKPRRADRFDIHDEAGHAPEVICRAMLGLSLAFAFFECFLQLATF